MDINTPKPPLMQRTLTSKDLVSAKPEDFEYSRFQLRIWHGMTFGAWYRLLKGNLRKVSTSRYGLLLSVTLLSLGNSFLKLMTSLIYGRKINAIKIEPDPVFIFGHWRSGTTWLNQLLGHDDNHASATAIQCFSPETFLIIRKFIGGIFLPSKRPMDNVGFTGDSPEEDEFCLLLGGVASPYRTLAFPCDAIDGLEISPNEMTDDEAVFWRKTWLSFLKTVQFCNPDKRLVLKSPAHTLRIAEILKHFPNAKFVHIVRDPYKIIPSSVKSNSAMAATQSLQNRVPSPEATMEITLQNFVGFHEAYNECKELIPKENLLTIHYEDLRENTRTTVSRIYSNLDLGDFSKVSKNFDKYVEGKKGYVNNHYNMPSETESLIYSFCKPFFDQYEYKRMSDRKPEV